MPKKKSLYIISRAAKWHFQIIGSAMIIKHDK